MSVGGEDNGGAGGAEGCLDVCALEGEACCFDGAACVRPAGGCKIEVLAAVVSVTKDYAALEQRVGALDPEVLVSLRDPDVTSAAVAESPASRLELHLSAQASATAAALTQAYLHPFRVSCDEESLFVGVVYSQVGAAAIETPVLHVSQSADESLVLRLGAWEGAWQGPSQLKDAQLLAARLDRAELRAAFCRDGVLSKLD